MSKNVYNYKLNKPVYDNCDVLRVEYEYSKSKLGYIASVSAVTLTKYGAFGSTISSGYFNHQPISFTIIPCGRRNAKKEEEGFETFKQNARTYAEKYIEVYKLAERGIKIVEEV